MAQDVPGLAATRDLLVGREVSAVCFGRDYVELHFDGPVVRALTLPLGMHGCQVWRFPEGQSPSLMCRFIGEVVDGFVIVPGRHAQLSFGEHTFTIPLGEQSPTGPEALHIVGVDEDGRPDARQLWIY